MNSNFELVGMVVNWPTSRVYEEIDSLIRHMDEDALTQSEWALLAVCAWRLANE